MEEADKIYTGTYSAQDTAKVNSSFVISIDDGPGLKLEQWASDSQDISQVVKALNGIETPDIQLYPTRLQQKQNGCVHQSFRAVFGSTSSGGSLGLVTGSSISWKLVDSYRSGNIGVDEFLFELDAGTGEVVSVSPRALRQTLQKS
ncbi:hypothetical protein TMatcc_008397 [Talaromyces marneffei ATCC 18224]|uniref:uncharacterized protein n=1 Tax=Talaromyces marneffei TaxID=37727 RepID=UPI0012A8BC11|nr:uncharacterized protein EYB26_007741 [Talaromyces marneffei]KAE8550375.1 hypothetical protein EYB25_006601 [Talaromyces marneffei]QGA20041.1 hypothetical protein EYB26_007741 [Talaromyces marneffei]